jgi:hypothetical protein
MGLFTPTAKAPTKKNIFISYRVHDTAGETGRLVDSLKQYFYEDQIFVDIDKIEPGVDFTEAIAKSLESCDVMLAIIGPGWQGINAADHSSRINNPNDWVRLEISTALKRNIRVVPVLVDGAELPTAEQLPEDLQSLLRRQAYEISNKRWKYDTEELIRFLVKSVGILPKNLTTEPVKKESSWWSKNYPWVILVGVLVIGLGIVTNQAGENGLDNNSVHENKPINKENQKIDDTQPQTTTEKEYYIAGNWYDANGLYYLTISQNANTLSVASYSMAGQQTGQGNGSINGNNVLININVTGYGIFTITSTLSQDEKSLTGSLKIENNGAAYTEPLRLNKVEN